MWKPHCGEDIPHGNRPPGEVAEEELGHHGQQPHEERLEDSEEHDCAEDEWRRIFRCRYDCSREKSRDDESHDVQHRIADHGCGVAMTSIIR